MRENVAAFLAAPSTLSPASQEFAASSDDL
jgi:hypothetical protein